jgi:hypothetical protein
MSHQDWNDIFWLIEQGAIFFAALASFLRSRLNSQKIDDVKEHINGRMDELLQKHGEARYKEGFDKGVVSRDGRDKYS